MPGTKFTIRDETRQRCKILNATAEELAKFRDISLELRDYFFHAKAIDFSFYFRAGSELIEFIKPEEFSKELLTKLWASAMTPGADVSVCLLVSEYPRFEKLITGVREQKIKDVIEKDPSLDRLVLEVYADLSNASQLIVKGGINAKIAQQAKHAVSRMMAQQVHSEIMMGTLGRMILADSSLYDHSATVAMISGIIAHKSPLGKLSSTEAELVARCGLYHDTGKTCVPAHILNKPGLFTPAEFEIMKTHTTLGYEELLNAIGKGAPIEEVVARVALEHHERWDGHGYPHKRSGRLEEKGGGIHLYSRIVAIADVYSALLMKRVYKEAYTQDKALEVMRGLAPRDFDPDLFKCFEDCVEHSFVVFNEKEKKRKEGQIIIVEQGESISKALQSRNHKQSS